MLRVPHPPVGPVLLERRLPPAGGQQCPRGSIANLAEVLSYCLVTRKPTSPDGRQRFPPVKIQPLGKLLGRQALQCLSVLERLALTR